MALCEFLEQFDRFYKQNMCSIMEAFGKKALEFPCHFLSIYSSLANVFFNEPFESSHIWTASPDDAKENKFLKPVISASVRSRDLENRIPQLKKIHFEMVNVCGRCKYDWLVFVRAPTGSRAPPGPRGGTFQGPTEGPLQGPTPGPRASPTGAQGRGPIRAQRSPSRAQGRGPTSARGRPHRGPP